MRHMALGLLLFFATVAHANTNTLTTTFDQTTQRLRIKTADTTPGGSFVYDAALPGGVVAVTADEDTVYALNADAKELTLVTTLDLASTSEAHSFAPIAKVSLAEEIKETPVDIAVMQTGEQSIVYISTRSETNARTKVYRFVFMKRRRLSKDETANLDSFLQSNSDATLTDAEPQGPSAEPSFLASLKTGPVEILGSGPITMVSDPQSYGTALLSYDRENKLLHRYNVSNPFSTEYERSYDFSFLKITDESEIMGVTLTKAGETGSDFFLQMAGQQVRLSLIDLDARMALQRAAFMMEWKNDSANVWTKQLLGLSYLSWLVDSLDSRLGHPGVDFESFLDNADVAKLNDGLSADEVLAWAKNSGLFSTEEFQEMQTDYKVAHARGRKWFVMTTSFVGALTYLRLRSTRALHPESNSLGRKLMLFAARSLERAGVSPKTVATLKHPIDAAQRRFRSYLLKRMETQRHQTYLIGKMQRRLEKLAKLSDDVDVSQLTSLPKNAAIGERVAAILEATEQVAKMKVSSLNKSAKGKKWNKLQAPLLRDFEKLKVQEQALTIANGINAIKIRIMRVLRQAEGKSVEAAEHAQDVLNFAKVSDKASVLAKAEEASSAVKQLYGEGSARALAYAKRFDEDLPRLLDDLAVLRTEMDNWVTKGHNHPMFDLWARVSSAYAQFFLPERAYDAMRFKVGSREVHVGNGLRKWVRLDHITHGNQVEKIAITGAEARLAITTGLADCTGDVITQWMARRNLDDPDEHIWGSGDNHIEFVPWGGKSYGIHFDLLAGELINIWGWSMSMPISYARMGANHGSKKQISYLQRLWDAQKKSLNPAVLGWGIAQSWPMWYLSKQVVLADYRGDHAEELKSQDPAVRAAALEKLAEFKKDLTDRTTSSNSIFERILFNKSIGIPYINPQYLIQNEVDGALKVLFKSKIPSTVVSMLVMPVSTGYFYSKWWGEYFGFHNPATVRLMERFKIEGVLEKIDEHGQPKLELWSEHERQMFTLMTGLLEMSRLEKVQPIPEGASAEEVAKWYEQVFANITEKDAGPERIATGPDDFIYQQEAEDLLAVFNRINKGIAKFPLLYERDQDKMLAVTRQSADTLATGNIEELQRNLDKLTYFHKVIVASIEAMRANRGVIGEVNTQSWALSLVDTVILADLFFAGSKLPAAARKIAKNWGPKAEKLINRLGIAGLVGQVPYFHWLNEQGQAHLEIEAEINQLLLEMHSSLLATTEIFMVSFLQSAYEDATSYDVAVPELTKFRKELGKTRELMHSLLFESKMTSEDLLLKRRYRWADIYRQYAPFGMGAGLAWMGGRSFLAHASKGFFTRMTDVFAKRLTQASFLGWIFFGQLSENHRRVIELSTHDFFTLYQAYYSLTVETKIIEVFEEAARAHRSVTAEDLRRATQSAHEDPSLVKFDEFKSRLLSLITDETSEERQAAEH